MPIILNDKFKYNSATQIGLKSPSVTSIIGNTAGVKIIGGTATTADLSFQTTSGVGETGADMHFLVGNNGATEAVTILNSGNVGIGTTGPGAKLSFATGTTAADGIDFGGDTNLYRLSANILQSDDQFRAGNLYTEGTFYTNTWTGTSTDHDITAKIRDNKKFYINNNENGTIVTVDESNGNVGIGTTAPTNLLSLGGESARIFWMERELTADTAGNTLTITAGGATSGATNKAGGALILQGGLSTGSAESGVTIQGCVAGAAGTADRTQVTAIQVLGNKLGFWTATPVVQSTGWAISNKTADKVLDCNVTTIDELADLVGTIVDTLKDYGLFAA